MSVIVWDGKTLAADRYADMCGARAVAEKLFLLPTNEVVGFTGALSTGMFLMSLYRVGKLESHWPATQSSDDWARLVVGRSDGLVVYYERSPAAIPVYSNAVTWGAGQDFARMALHLGEDAVSAVLNTNDCCGSCSYGVTAFTYLNKTWVKKYD